MRSETDSPSTPRVLFGGFLMGLANLVPGISGGTMILVIGLYDRFIGAVADVTRLRLKRDSLMFLALMGTGLGVAVLSLSGLAVSLVSEHRWLMYSLFIGMTLGALPDLWKLMKPLSPGVAIGFLFGLALMVAIAWYKEAEGLELPDTTLVLMLVGALAASSMVLPGISGSYVLLILGMYELVIGSASLSAVKEDPAGCGRIIGAVGVGAAAGIGLLSNLLKALLVRFSPQVHATLAGLVLGSVVGLWPFQEPVHPELANKYVRKTATMLVAGAEHEAVLAKYASKIDGLDEARLVQLEGAWSGRSAGELKRLGDQLRTFEPTGGQIGSALALLLLGLGATRLIARSGKAAD